MEHFFTRDVYKKKNLDEVSEIFIENDDSNFEEKKECGMSCIVCIAYKQSFTINIIIVLH